MSDVVYGIQLSINLEIGMGVKTRLFYFHSLNKFYGGGGFLCIEESVYF